MTTNETTELVKFLVKKIRKAGEKGLTLAMLCRDVRRLNNLREREIEEVVSRLGRLGVSKVARKSGPKGGQPTTYFVIKQKGPQMYKLRFATGEFDSFVETEIPYDQFPIIEKQAFRVGEGDDERLDTSFSTIMYHHEELLGFDPHETFSTLFEVRSCMSLFRGSVRMANMCYSEAVLFHFEHFCNSSDRIEMYFRGTAYWDESLRDFSVTHE